MALITCPECGENISDKATTCPRCGFPLQSQSTIEKHCNQSKSKKAARRQLQLNSKRRTKKAIRVLLIILAIVVSVAIAAGAFVAYIKRPKDEAYLYEWMTENASLIDGTRLQYTDTQKNGSKFTLNYDACNYVESMKWYIEYDIPEREGYCTTVHVTLYWEDDECPATITVSGTGNLDGYNRTLKYSHNPEIFTRGSPIKTNSYSGSTVPSDGNIPELCGSSFLDPERLLQSKLDYMDQKCLILAHVSLCEVLDWLNESFCPEANMSMSDFGYTSYE